MKRRTWYPSFWRTTEVVGVTDLTYGAVIRLANPAAIIISALTPTHTIGHVALITIRAIRIPLVLMDLTV
jgi:hypothetical protein